MIKYLKSKEYEKMSKYDAFEILHQYLVEENKIILNHMLDQERTKTPDWAMEQNTLVAQLKYIKKIRGFLPNQGKEDGR